LSGGVFEFPVSVAGDVQRLVSDLPACGIVPDPSVSAEAKISPRPFQLTPRDKTPGFWPFIKE
jgi:hypothetical protein